MHYVLPALLLETGTVLPVRLMPQFQEEYALVTMAFTKMLDLVLLVLWNVITVLLRELIIVIIAQLGIL